MNILQEQIDLHLVLLIVFWTALSDMSEANILFIESLLFSSIPTMPQPQPSSNSASMGSDSPSMTPLIRH